MFLVDQLPGAEHAVLSGQEGHHAATVRRLRPGAELVLTDGRGAAVRCVVAEVNGKDTLDLRVLRRWREPRPAPAVTVVQALVKGDRGELAVELATEAGADRLVPWRAARCVARWDEGARGAKALAKWRATAREAGKQARRAWLPDVTEPVGLAELAELVRASQGALLLDNGVGNRLADAKLLAGNDLMLIIGPEGGVTEEETSVLLAAGAQVVRLGPTVLRASTAAAVALGALGVLTPRWR